MSSAIETPLETINQQDSKDVGISDFFDKGMETLKFLHEMSGLKTYMELRIVPHYKVKTVESAMKLCLRCQKTYEMIDEWMKIVDLIDQRNELSENVH